MIADLFNFPREFHLSRKNDLRSTKFGINKETKRVIMYPLFQMKSFETCEYCIVIAL